ncbi:ABC transporter ATP-binding protein [Beggiatoa leptomitoformis]|uniref:ATP-binding cassette domain-containing protein n=1 Tax=Beggiatoa leptomitoformis TaxID=288004 RepID=A0A2N9YJG8_9GAMM|nr:ATP-binding cassette domain-containing protein [Beggiatoa leptomitoformis]ALG69453.2 ATP-binding cassette domain-containing protein [Beggiatoa leptomitoformis]AUI70633.2 ATP-binding cassette domain-containing protein [Beggiatoa leptomitoformis]
MMNTLLSVEHLTMRFSGLIAIDDVSFRAQPQQITAIIGPNGAGKTTLFNCLTGFYSPTAGQLKLCYEEKSFLLERLRGFEITRDARVVRTFQNIRLFPAMSVLENLIVAQHNQLMRASGFTFKGLFGFRSYQQAERAALDLACYWLERIDLLNYADTPAGSLPYGAQRKLEIARAMCTCPKLLCLDEPAAGLNPSESLALSELLLFIKQQHDVGILLIEHDMQVVMDISDHIIVLDYGRKIAQGTPAEIRVNPVVIAAYLGEEVVGGQA